MTHIIGGINDIKKLLQSRQRPLVNFDWQDIADLTGYINYVLWKSEDSVGINRNLIPSSISSGHDIDSAGEITARISNTTFVKVLDVDFDLSEFQLPRTIKGKALLKMAYATNDSAGNVDAYVIIRVRKWDGSSETEIASVQSVTGNNDTGSSKLVNLNLQLTIPQTLIKKGEQLRLTFEGWAKGNAGPDYTMSVPSNPTTNNTLLTMPYRMNL